MKIWPLLFTPGVTLKFRPRTQKDNRYKQLGCTARVKPQCTASMLGQKTECEYRDALPLARLGQIPGRSCVAPAPLRLMQPPGASAENIVSNQAQSQ